MVENLTLYRKYRPKKFPDFFGQEPIVKILETSIKNKTFSHSYIFSGSRGTGKTSAARIMAIEIGINIKDIYEIDAASNRGIGEIKDLKASLNSPPFFSKYKCYIIDEVHMLTKEAFNALLKILEEPPSYIIFILATTEYEKIPETIISRCQIINFKTPTTEVVLELLKFVAKKEKITITEESLNLIALLGENSFRDALSKLQTLIFDPRKKIIESDILEIFSLPNYVLISDFINNIKEGQKQKSIDLLNEIKQKNQNFDFFLKILAEKLRSLFSDSILKIKEINEENKFFYRDFLLQILELISSNKDRYSKIILLEIFILNR